MGVGSVFASKAHNVRWRLNVARKLLGHGGDGMASQALAGKLYKKGSKRSLPQNVVSGGAEIATEQKP